MATPNRDPILQAFKLQADSLKIPASRIAALTGYHPYASLPELFIDFIYQGSTGHALKLQDCRELGMELVSEEVLLMELARKAGSGTIKAFEAAMQVKEGTKVLDNVNVAATVKRKVLEEAKKSKKLNPQELRRLEEGSRQYVNTGFGVCHEDAALNLFEAQCGWKVGERNAVVMYWPFARGDDCHGPNMSHTVLPLTNAYSEERSTEASIDLNDDEGAISQTKNCKPFFTLCGAFDGVREELCCRQKIDASQGIEEEEWDLRKVIVECKHRMREVKNMPPLYDQIQTVAYCLMYDAEVADIVQVFRTDNPPERRSKRNLNSMRESSLGSIDESLPTKDNNCEESPCSSSICNGNDTEQQLQSQPRDSPMKKKSKRNKDTVEIFVSRLALDDGLMNHRLNWHSVILPRLRSFVDAVYRVRADDDLRKLFLQVVSEEAESGSSPKVSWDLLHRECPWLQECDTAWHRM